MIKEFGNLTSLKVAPVYPEGFDPKVVKVWFPKFDEYVKLHAAWVDGMGQDLRSPAVSVAFIRAFDIMTATLDVTDLRKQFAIGRPAIDGVSFAVPAGEIVVLLGPSGCGKTTTLRCVAGLEHPTSGEITHRRPRGVVARARHSGAAAAARPRHGVSVLRGMAAHDRAAERGLSAEAPQDRARRGRPQGRRGAGAGRADGICRPAGGGAVGRPDAARRAGAQHRLPAAAAAARRAACRTSTPNCACGCATICASSSSRPA